MSVLELDRESNRDLIGMNPTAASARNSCYLSGRKAILFPRVLQYQDIKDSKKLCGAFLTLQTVLALRVNKIHTCTYTQGKRSWRGSLAWHPGCRTLVQRTGLCRDYICTTLL